MVEVSTLGTKKGEESKTFFALEVAKTDYFHIDVMDGKFVKNNTYQKMFENASYIKRISNLPLDIHLMVEDVKDAISAEVVDGTRVVEIKVKSENKDDVKVISKEILPVFQDVVQKKLERNKLVIADYPSKVEAEQNVSTKKMMVVGAAGGFVIAAGIFFIMYLVNLSKKAKRN